ncbi:LysR family transcriptional regulator [Aquicoccus sp. G2-2]|jgi:LysR family nitrogen assimilation transcriptional regulator|uniref:LysR family transcriptional regulator n=1 Tax=Aquicoccus sp. G2-2 TaxID=3092120 RepID=UPI002ADFEF5E|nr:LysR substrate-binding domain-containing protein [Aquicoccus sp. G2-2]MEA1114869.1 LysR substrate-binding domain-containing protein [Aquicoccus sp. G2-2]
MDIRQLRYFVAIVEHGSFSRAAEAVHVAQPALSLHVRNMEAELDTKLLFRNPKGVVPTEAGEILLRNARIILDQLTVTEEEVRGHENDPSGVVRLGLPGTISEILSVPLIMAARSRYPKVELRIAEAMSGFVLEWLSESRIDLAVIYRNVNENGLASVELLEEDLVFFAPSQGLNDKGILPAADATPELAEVAHLPLIVPAKTHGLRMLIDNHANATGVALNVAIEVDSYANIKELVSAGLGCSILPLNAISREVAAGRLTSWRTRDTPLRRSAFMAYPVARPMTNAVTAIRNLAEDVLRDLARNGSWIGARVLPVEPD